MTTPPDTHNVGSYDRIGVPCANLAAWSGGPQTWWEAGPSKCMVSRHAPLGIDSAAAGQWADSMRGAIADSAPGDSVSSEAQADTLIFYARPAVAVMRAALQQAYPSLLDLDLRRAPPCVGR